MVGLDDALILTCVVEYRSFTQAAQGLGMQKSAVSRRVALLEERLGVRLPNRTIRKLHLTEVGQVCYERHWQIMHGFVEAEQTIVRLQQAPSGLLWITLLIEFGQMFLVSLLGDLVHQYPQITAEAGLASHSIDPLQEGIDIVTMVDQPGDSTSVARRLLSTSRWLCASPDYLAAHGMPTSVVGPAEHHVVLPSTDSQRYWPLSGDSLPYQRVLSCNSITFVRETMVAGAGIAVLSALICAESVHNGHLAYLLADIPLLIGELYAVYPSWRFQTMEVKAFLDFLINRLLTSTGRLLGPEAARLITLRP